MTLRTVLMVLGIWSFSGLSAWALEWSPLQVSLIGEKAQLVPKDIPVYGLRLNLLTGSNTSVAGIDVGIIGMADSAKGIQVNLIFNGSCGDNERWGRCNSHSDSYGMQIALGNAAWQYEGIQFGWANSATAGIDGMQLAVYANRAGIVRGTQTAIFNLSEQLYGVQVGAINVSSNPNGLQLGIVNVNDALDDKNKAGSLYGIQMGIYNYAASVYGMQIGMVNRTASLHGVQIGLVNAANNGVMPWTLIINAAF